VALVSIVVPVYHNAPSLPELHERFQALATRHPADRFEFVFVDDGSGDDSFAVLEGLAAADPRVRVVKLSRNFGSNAAILAGLEHARGDAVGCIAADLQDPPELFDEMLGHWRAGRKVVLAARSTRDDPGLTALFADAFYGLFRRFALKTMPKRGFDFFLLDRRLCDCLKGMKESNPYLMGLILWLGFDPAVVHYHRRERPAKFGRSMWTLSRKLKYFADAFVAFSYAPLRAASLTGLGLSICGQIYAVWIVVLKLTSGIHVDGWASLMIVLLVVSGGQLVMTGILGEYLWRSLEEARRRPRFLVDRLVESPAAAALESDRQAAA
jgi:dolichol-phosphate mannosyltransferase